MEPHQGFRELGVLAGDGVGVAWRIGRGPNTEGLNFCFVSE